ncbi:MAG: cell surface protein SprA [Bacteroidaceae bacterium]|nr:cell surface protein SprA [Bacteroidaceae bacterium]
MQQTQASSLLAGSQRQTLTLRNLQQTQEYDDKENSYSIGTKLGDNYLETPMIMTQQEYQEWSIERSMREYFRQKNSETFQEEGHDKFDFTDMHFDLGPAEKIFGPGGVQVKTQGSATIKIGGDHKVVNNPALTPQNRTTGGFDFDMKFNVNVNAKVGDKIDMRLNYNTESTFDFDAKNIKLKYEGKDDEIIKLIEAGNVSFPTNSRLIQGAQSLFGIRTDLQFGKLRLQMVLSQKNSSSKSVSAKGGNQVTDFEIDVTNYDENRHFFLGHYFRDTYNDNMSMLPTIMSGINITRIELWVTNKRSNYESPRNIVAFADLAESRHISNTDAWTPMVGATQNPKNQNNTLYNDVAQGPLSAIRNIDQVAAVLNPILQNGNGDYEKISNARRLASNEYTLNSALGYVSLNTALSADEVLAVAYEYTLNGQVYQVGEFSTDVPDADQSLVLKLLKSNSNSPGSGTWDLMMKNVYSLGSGQLNQNGFKLYVCYLNDSTGCYINYLPESDLKSVPLNQLLGLDRIDSKGNALSDGEFDYLQGYTVQEQRGRIIFPVVEPFGAYLEEVGGESAQKYVFNELYDSTRVIASRIASKNKFALTGQYSGSARNVIDLGAYNIPQGSVTVTAGGTTLIPNLDYTIDYSLGRVTIINQSIIDAGTQVNVQMESNTEFSMQRKTMAGINLIYNPTKELNLTGTVMHMNERPLTSKVVMGNEPLVNTMLGAGIDWKHKSNGLTKVVNLLPFVNTTRPSEIRFNAEVAGLISKVSDKVQGSSSYIDDFESAEGGIDISAPTAWTLSAIPMDVEGSNLSDNIETGYRRALLNWFSVDPLFTRRNSMLTPAHLKGDLDQLSNHFVREVYERELYPNKESVSSESTTLRVLNLAFYPNERGPYNLNPDLDSEGFLRRPEQNWGGIMRSITTTNFEAANIEYVEFWLMDPFVYDGPAAAGGDMFFELGEVSEDVLKDGKKFFENGLPTNDDATKYTETVWGRVPNITSLVYAFDNSEINNRKKQDVGLNGLSSEQERNFPTYSDYLAQIKPVVSPERYKDFEDDPANDNYHYFLGDDYDDQQLSILERYKRYNGTEGNSPNSDELSQKFNSSASVKPDVEDANTDYTLDEHEKYFQYHISVRPSDLEIGRNYIVDKRVVNSKLRNGNTEEVTWFRFRIPIDQYSKVVGGIRDFSSIRFARIWLKGFAQTVHLRFGTMQLRTSSWRNYEQPIANAQNQNAFLSGEMSQASVNIEINGDRRPVNYVVPPGITRILDPTQTQLVQDNEQALSLRATNLAAGQARGIYKPSNLDLRRYERLQMFAHVESLIGSVQQINDGDISVFIRLGSDYTNNYYEYEIPLKVTPEGIYSGESTADRYIVWPKENMLDIPITLLSQIKLNRPAGQNVYSEYDPDKPENRITVAGNPSTGNVRAIMIGMRNNSQNTKDAEVWVNELRLCGYESNGGMAAQSTLNIKLADVANVDMNGQMHTHGFGGLEDKVASRSLDDYYKYSVTTSGDAGRLLPAKAKVSIPVYYSYTKEQSSPQYNPFDTDVELKNSSDSIKKLASTVSEQKNFSITGAKVNIYSKKRHMPYDPANFKFDFSHSVENNRSGTIEYERQLDWRVALTYQYEPQYKPWKPFVKEKWGNALCALQVNWLPQSVQFNTDLQRNYYEIQDRDMSTIRFGGENSIPVRFSQQYYWNRKFSMRWDLFSSLKMNISTATRAEIEEPYVVVNKAIYPDQYTMWKDSVRHSLEKLGNPLDYQQNFSASYQIPLDKFSIFSWLKSDASYSSAYAWKRGTTQKNGMNYGNTINNSRTIGANAHLNFETLYNFIPGVKNMLQEMQKIRDKRTAAAKNPALQKKPATNTTKQYSQEMDLVPGQKIVVSHNQNSTKPIVSVILADGTKYSVKVKTIDENTVELRAKDSIHARVVVKPQPADPKGDKLNENTRMLLMGTARMLMMIRRINITYKGNYSTSLPGFAPNIGAAFGQNNASGLAPGLAFAFGATGQEFIDKAYDNGWLVRDRSLSYTTNYNRSHNVNVQVNLEPFNNFRIDVNSSWNRSYSTTTQIAFDARTNTYSGSMSMTTISMGSCFEGHNAKRGYASKTFDRFVRNLDIVQARVQAQYAGAVYPESMTGEGGKKFDPETYGGVDKYSADVMIPAFLAAYTGGNASKHSLDIFPRLFAMLPNWTLSYGGLSKLAAFQKVFKSFNINHAYKSQFSMGQYSTYASFHEYMDGLGFISNVQTGNPIPSSMYNINTVSINESFVPLIGVSCTMQNNVSARLEYRKTRVLNLSMSAQQIMETTSDDIVVGAGYKIVGLKLFGAKPGTGNNKISNDLDINLDFSLRNQSALNRNIAKQYTQATSGNRAVRFAFKADYTWSRMLTMSLYYDYQSNFPLVTTSAFPTSTHDFGMTLKFSLAR